MDLELEYEESSNHSSYFKAYREPMSQPSPEHPTNVLIIVPMPLIDVLFPCCPGCEVLNKPVTELVLIKKDHPIMLFSNNQGQAARMQVVCTSQHGHCGGHSDY